MNPKSHSFIGSEHMLGIFDPPSVDTLESQNPER